MKKYLSFIIYHLSLLLILLCAGCATTSSSTSPNEPLTISMDAVGRMKMDSEYVTMDDITKRFASDKSAKRRQVVLKGEEGARTERLIALRGEIVKLGNPNVMIQTARQATATTTAD